MADNFFSGLNNFSGISPINLMEFSIENLLLENFPFHDNEIISNDDVCRKRKELSTPANSSSAKNNASGRGKKAKRDEAKATEVVHVRAKRGQATDNHSLAERVRRQKINDKLRCLQDIVPGCYKNMGMAVMLDEIINYVQSLQNQVEFLSMKLTAASMETDALERAKAIQAFNNHNSFF